MKRITLPVSGAGSNCFYIALAAHFVLLYHNRKHSDEQYQVFQRALNQALDTQMPLDKVITLPYDGSSQILGIAFRAYLGQATNDNAEVDASEAAGNETILELFPEIYYTQDPNATADSLCMRIPDMTPGTIGTLDSTYPVIQWINGGHYQLLSVDSMVDKLPGVQVRPGDAKARVEENQAVIEFRSAVGERSKAFFSSRRALSPAAQELFLTVIISLDSTASADGGDSASMGAASMFGHNIKPLGGGTKDNTGADGSKLHKTTGR